MDFKLINRETLQRLGACAEGIEWFVKNIGTLPVEKLKLVEGDYRGYVTWARKAYQVGKKPIYEEHGNSLTCRNINGRSWTRTYDKDLNVLAYKDSNGYSWKKTYDEHGNLLTYKSSVYSWEKTYDEHKDALTCKDSTGYSWEKKYDAHKNVLMFKHSSGFSWEQTYDAAGRVLTYKDSDGTYESYAYEKTDTHFVMTRNGDIILKVST